EIQPVTACFVEARRHGLLQPPVPTVGECIRYPPPQEVAVAGEFSEQTDVHGCLPSGAATERAQLSLSERVTDAVSLESVLSRVTAHVECHVIADVGDVLEAARVQQSEECPRSLERDVRMPAGAIFERSRGGTGAGTRPGSGLRALRTM